MRTEEYADLIRKVRLEAAFATGHQEPIMSATQLASSALAALELNDLPCAKDLLGKAVFLLTTRQRAVG